MSKISRLVRVAGLAAIAPVGAILGGYIDERVHLGFTNWRAACRASGISFASLLHFTLELLPTAIIGSLFGGLLVQLLAFSARHDSRGADQCLAAHLGCALAMPLGLLLCALALPLPWMLVTEIALGTAAAFGVLALWNRRIAASVPLHP